MRKFRKKPVVIEAEQFNGTQTEIVGHGAMFINWPILNDDKGQHLIIETLEGNHRQHLRESRATK
jgi:hypothetical protein